MLLMIEDHSFFQHKGVDFREIVRVVRDYYWNDKPMRGASTITQQLIKNSLLTHEKTLTRKFNEALMALLLEASFDKEMILNRYMNSVYLGHPNIRRFIVPIVITHHSNNFSKIHPFVLEK
jgi:penicillin-binding protein 1B